VEFNFKTSKLREKHFSTKTLVGKFQTSKACGAMHPHFPTPG